MKRLLTQDDRFDRIENTLKRIETAATCMRVLLVDAKAEGKGRNMEQLYSEMNRMTSQRDHLSREMDQAAEGCRRAYRAVAARFEPLAPVPGQRESIAPCVSKITPEKAETYDWWSSYLEARMGAIRSMLVLGRSDGEIRHQLSVDSDHILRLLPRARELNGVRARHVEPKVSLIGKIMRRVGTGS